MISLKSVENHYNSLKEKYENGTISLFSARLNAITLLAYVAEIYNNLDNIKINERDKKVYITYHKKIKQLIDEIDYLLDEKTI